MAQFCGARGPNSCISEVACSQLPSPNHENGKLKSLTLFDSILNGKCPGDFCLNPEIWSCFVYVLSNNWIGNSDSYGLGLALAVRNLHFT